MAEFLPYDATVFSTAKRHHASKGRCSFCEAEPRWMRKSGVVNQAYCDAHRAAYEANPRRRRAAEKAAAAQKNANQVTPPETPGATEPCSPTPTPSTSARSSGASTTPGSASG